MCSGTPTWVGGACVCGVDIAHASRHVNTTMYMSKRPLNKLYVSEKGLWMRRDLHVFISLPMLLWSYFVHVPAICCNWSPIRAKRRNMLALTQMIIFVLFECHSTTAFPLLVAAAAATCDWWIAVRARCIVIDSSKVYISATMHRYICVSVYVCQRTCEHRIRRRRRCCGMTFYFRFSSHYEYRWN